MRDLETGELSAKLGACVPPGPSLELLLVVHVVIVTF